MRIKITQCSSEKSWYKNYIGAVLEVIPDKFYEDQFNCFKVTEPIDKTDTDNVKFQLIRLVSMNDCVETDEELFMPQIEEEQETNIPQVVFFDEKKEEEELSKLLNMDLENTYEDDSDINFKEENYDEE